MTEKVTLTIDGKQISVPAGTLVVDAAKQAGIDIPVFCYHPKMEPVGMCRMCLVEIGRPVRNRETGEWEKNEDGSLKIQFGGKLDTACTVPVSEGMVVIGMSDKVKKARQDIIEFLLTSHPLDCPVCDKGGECPLQELTMAYGPTESRFLLDEKMHLEKHVPLGELIYLDRERCIQCARCIRFQRDVVDDPVLSFFHRGRHTDIITESDPPFDSYWSGNTTDICPVGALTTADFRFGARPWELKYTASLSPHSPVGANLSVNVRREAKSGGKVVIKRIMPRQNEWVNEIWISDKDRFGYHFYESEERLTQPLIRKDGELKPTSWDDSLDKAAEAIKTAGEDLLTIVSGRLSNEDLFNLKKLTEGVGGKVALYSQMAGGDLVTQFGLPPESNFANMGHGTTILVVASDLEEEAPIWWLRVKQAAQRGATLIVANPRPTKLERYATHVLRYTYGQEADTVLSLLTGDNEAGKAFANAENAVVIFGNEGLGLEGSKALSSACAKLLVETNHYGRPNNGLIGVWEHPNTQGAWELGIGPLDNLAEAIATAKAVYIIAANPAGDLPVLADAVKKAPFVIVQELFPTATTTLADVVFPAQTLFEREGTFTSGERRVQRYYPAVSPLDDCKADFDIAAELAKRLEIELPARFGSLVMNKIAAEVPAYQGITYQSLANVVEQLPIIGRDDLYYGGTSYENKQGIGIQLTPTSMNGKPETPNTQASPKIETGEGGFIAVPVTRLYDRGELIYKSTMLHQRIPEPYVAMNENDAEKAGVSDGDNVTIQLNGEYQVVVRTSKDVPAGFVLVPRSMGIPITHPTTLSLVGIQITN